MSSSESASVGTTTKHLAQATVVGGCIDGNHTTGSKKNNNLAYATVPCSQQGNPAPAVRAAAVTGPAVYANTYSSTQQTLDPKPTHRTELVLEREARAPLRLQQLADGIRRISSRDPTSGPQPRSTRRSSTTTRPGIRAFRRATRSLRTRSISPSSSTDLEAVMHANSFDCRYYDSSGNLIGRRRVHLSRLGQRESRATRGSDDLRHRLHRRQPQLRGNDYVLYQGTGTIYVNGTVSFSNGANLCAVPISGNPCLGNFDTTQNLLEIVAVNAGNAADGWATSGSTHVRGNRVPERELQRRQRRRATTAR